MEKVIVITDLKKAEKKLKKYLKKRWLVKHLVSEHKSLYNSSGFLAILEKI